MGHARGRSRPRGAQQANQRGGSHVPDGIVSQVELREPRRVATAQELGQSDRLVVAPAKPGVVEARDVVEGGCGSAQRRGWGEGM